MALSKVLQRELTETQSPSALKKLLAEHSRQVSLAQILQKRLLSGTMEVSVLATQFPASTMEP